MENKNKIEVNICGKSLILVASEPQEYIEKISMYINEKASQIENAHSMHSKLLLLSVNITDELLKEREKNIKLQKNLEQLKTELAKSKYKTKSVQQNKN